VPDSGLAAAMLISRFLLNDNLSIKAAAHRRGNGCG
jgi:hypothetical protein